MHTHTHTQRKRETHTYIETIKKKNDAVDIEQITVITKSTSIVMTCAKRNKVDIILVKLSSCC